jgi:hypothetical protein
MLLNANDILDFFSKLPVGLIAAGAFLFLAFFVMLLWLEVGALVRALQGREGNAALIKRLCDDLDRLEDKAAKLGERLNGLAPRAGQGNNNGHD